jgi:hypothetical protein
VVSEPRVRGALEPYLFRQSVDLGRRMGPLEVSVRLYARGRTYGGGVGPANNCWALGLTGNRNGGLKRIVACGRGIE